MELRPGEIYFILGGIVSLILSISSLIEKINQKNEDRLRRKELSFEIFWYRVSFCFFLSIFLLRVENDYSTISKYPERIIELWGNDDLIKFITFQCTAITALYFFFKVLFFCRWGFDRYVKYPFYIAFFGWTILFCVENLQSLIGSFSLILNIAIISSIIFLVLIFILSEK